MRWVKVIGDSPYWFMPVSTQGYWCAISLLFPMEKLFENMLPIIFTVI